MPPVRPGRARGCSCSCCAWRRRGGRCWPSVSVPVSRWLLRRFPRGSVRSGMAKRDDGGGGRGSPLPALPVAQQPLGDEGPGGQEEQRAWGHGQAPPGHGLARGRGQRWHRWQRTPPHRHCSVSRPHPPPLCIPGSVPMGVPPQTSPSWVPTSPRAVGQAGGQQGHPQHVLQPQLTCGASAGPGSVSPCKTGEGLGFSWGWHPLPAPGRGRERLERPGRDQRVQLGQEPRGCGNKGAEGMRGTEGMRGVVGVSRAMGMRGKQQ